MYNSYFSMPRLIPFMGLLEWSILGAKQTANLNKKITNILHVVFPIEKYVEKHSKLRKIIYIDQYLINVSLIHKIETETVI